MLKNLFLVTWRSLARNKFYSFINIFGLSVGIASCLIIWMYVDHQLSFDRFHENVDDIYRVIRIQGPDKNREHAGVSEAPMGPTLMADYPEVIDYVRVTGMGATLVEHEETKLNIDRVLLAGASFFRMFSFPLIAGSADDALDEPMQVVLSHATAKRLFGSASDAVGKTVTLRQAPMTVTAVADDVPENSSIQFDMLVSFITVQAMGRDLETWRGDWLTSFVLLKKGTDVQHLDAQMPAFLERYMPRRAKYGNVLYLHPFADSHLGSNHITFGGGITQTSDIRYVYVFSAVGVFVLVIACINFMNLTTARSARRAAEIGIRKVVGAQRGQLVRQFLGESFGLTLLGFALAIGMVGLIGPAFDAAFSTKLDVSRILSPGFIPAGVAFILGVGLLAGIYPAFYLSAFNPVSVLKDAGTPRSSGTLVRKALVITQFAISSTLIIGTGLVLEQFDFLRNRNLGFNTDQVLVINIPDPAAMNGKLETLKAEFLQHPDILNTAASSVTLGRNFIRGGGATYESDEGPMEDINTRQMAVGYDFISTYGIEIVEGRDFSRDHALDVASFESENFGKPGSFLVNQEFLKRAGLKNPIGKSMKTGRGEFGEIVGVMKDFNFYTLHHQMEVLSVRLGPGDMFRRFAVKMKPNHIRETVDFIENKWQTTYDQPMAYTFLDDFFDAQYRREEITGKLVASFSGIAIIIACLGLIGLASYTSAQRTKEIGIRKTLGATVASVSILLSSQFLKLILLANVIAWPIVYTVIQDWLTDFAYRVTIGPLPFIEGALTVMAIALATVAYQAVRAAMTNPVDALKYE